MRKKLVGGEGFQQMGCMWGEHGAKGLSQQGSWAMCTWAQDVTWILRVSSGVIGPKNKNYNIRLKLNKTTITTNNYI